MCAVITALCGAVIYRHVCVTTGLRASSDRLDRYVPPHHPKGDDEEVLTMQPTPLFKMHRSASDFVEVVRWLNSNKLESHLRLHLSELPSHHLWWDAIIEELGEARLVELGVDI